MTAVISGLVALSLIAASLWWALLHPSHDRTWSAEQARMPRVVISGEHFTVHDVRNFRWSAGGEARQGWDTRSYDLSQVASLWYVLTPFSREWRGPAHAFVSFGFDDGRYLAISVEARREEGEAYSPLKGVLKRFELMYVIGDERDLIDLRLGRGDDVYLYPIRATREQVRAMLLEMLGRAQALADRPEFYGSVFNNCTTNLLDHVNRVAAEPIPFGLRVLLPGYSDRLAHERGMLDTDLPLEQARERFRVASGAGSGLEGEPDEAYSHRIRGVDG